MNINNTSELIKLLQEDTLPPSIQNLEVGEFYRFNGHNELFSSKFIMEIIEDNGAYYTIKIDNNIESILQKDFKLLEGFESGLIEKIDGHWNEEGCSE